MKKQWQCFFWCYIRHLNPLKIHHERITKADKQIINHLDYEGTKYPVSKKDCCKIETKNDVCTNVFCYEDNLIYPVYASDEKLKNCINLLLIIDKNNSHYVYIEDCNRFIYDKTRWKNKKYFLQILSTMF